jgi:capsular polysaccharide biosynthesis protein
VSVPKQTADLPKLSALARHSESLLDPVTFSVPNAVVYTNIAAHNPSFAAHLTKDIYVARDCALTGISLVELPAGATVLGGQHFVLKVDRALVFEQYPVYFPNTPEHIDEVLNAKLPVEEIAGEALLIARYGIFTWGHWLGELLPKAVLAEAAYPGRFTLVLPHQVLADQSPNLPWIRIKQSLAAYGIDERRVISVRPDRDYRFARLFAVTPVWSDHLMHPGAVELMRTAIRGQAALTRCRRMAIGRVSAYGRVLENHAEIEMLLRANDFAIHITGAMPFLEQVALFSHAELLFGVLGSDLTNLIYSPAGVKVITAAPAQFGDRFFYALVLARNGQQIDLRGPITLLNDDIAHKSMFRVDPAEVARAVALCTGKP